MPHEIGELKIYSLKEVYEALGVSDQTLRKYIKAGQLKARKIGSAWYTTEAALQEFYESGNFHGKAGRPSKSGNNKTTYPEMAE